MGDYRRKRLYIDKIFQKKFLILFLFLSLLGSIANVLFLLFFLKKDVENNLYRSRIVISNVNEIILNNVIYFNMLILILTVLVGALFYCLIRERVKNIVDKLGKSLQLLKKNVNLNDLNLELPFEFQDINRIIFDFYKLVDRRMKAESDAIASLKEFTSNPNDKIKFEAMNKVSKVLT